MISTLTYGNDTVTCHLAARVSGGNAAPEYTYMIVDLVSEFGSMRDEQIDYFLPGFGDTGEAETGWVSTPEAALKLLIAKTVEIFDEFNTWPQYADHGYLPGEKYDGTAIPFPPGTDPWGE